MARRRVALAGALAALTLLLAVSQAWAERALEAGPARVRTGTSFGVRIIPGAGELGSIECEVTLRWETHRQILKVSGTLFGFLNDVRWRACNAGGELVAVLRLPLHITYASFAGTLPRVSSVTVFIKDLRFLAEIMNRMARCLYEGDQKFIINGRYTEIRIESEPRLNRLRDLLGILPCPAGGAGLLGTIEVTPVEEFRLIR